MRVINLIYPHKLKKNEIIQCLMNKYGYEFLKTHKFETILVNRNQEVTVMVAPRKIEIMYKHFKDVADVICELVEFEFNQKILIKTYNMEEKMNTIQLLDMHECIYI